MIYSVWDRTAKRFDYYETSDPGPIHAPASAARGSSALGATPEQAAWPMPPGARKTGSGTVVRGRVARLGGIDLSDSKLPLVVGGLLLAALIGRKVLR